MGMDAIRFAFKAWWNPCWQFYGVFMGRTSSLLPQICSFDSSSLICKYLLMFVNLVPHFFFFPFLSFSTGDWTQPLVHAKQVFYFWATSSVLLTLFWDSISLNCPGWPGSLDPLALASGVIGITGIGYHAQPTHTYFSAILQFSICWKLKVLFLTHLVAKPGLICIDFVEK